MDARLVISRTSHESFAGNLRLIGIYQAKARRKSFQWIDGVEEGMLYISVMTVAEIQRGIERLPESHRKTQLQVWMNNGLVERFTERILPLDAETMLLWGSLMARSEQAGKPMGVNVNLPFVSLTLLLYYFEYKIV
jgi:predicted nucleic acid-binding protein